MKNISKIEIFRIDEFSAIPKYQQLVNTVLTAIKQGILKKGNLVPSINELSFEYEISRITVAKGYSKLCRIGILEAHHGKGYFIANDDIIQEFRILLMFNKLSVYKKIIYDAFVKSLNGKAVIDFYIYNNDFSLFKKILNQRKGIYTHYVIIPYITEKTNDFSLLMEQLPKRKLILVDKKMKSLTGNYAVIYEDFEEDIYKALSELLVPLSKYHILKLIFPKEDYFHREIINGFVNFCIDFAFTFKIVYTIDNETVNEGEAYIILIETDLVKIMNKIIRLNLTVGEQVGLISYNETPLKKFILNGLTTISTDFEAMGKTAAQLVLNSSKEHIKNPFQLVFRGSL